MSRIAETELYAPIKAWLEARGFEVKAEVGAADVVALRAGEEPVIIELKTGFSLALLQQAVARQAVTDAVYVAVPRWKGRAGWKAFSGNIGLCKRLGLGVLSVRLKDGAVEAHCDPVPFQPRKSKTRKSKLLKAFSRLEGDPNVGGTRGATVTVYRQDAEKCAVFLNENGASRGRDVAGGTGVENATTLMRDNHYGWFEKVEKGVYMLSASGVAALADAG
ncbi:DUF2161 domain-containing phosphodiesterase [Shimia sp. MMG029]|uniref:DUF2161 domain-containing phosphodiesterase n=1 Tax=Shimia sp. MMG029 TaxID=3021978 RepID=UPI0022FEA758|nr:DUF2161 family putative PD-(D/E)XK-type phosphodiesterase [Shimia sp. MMG029]MDA5557152.1 DUF2161 family putative PD-(D/E)XK-type phosphodiesterase [Shimia sp. MMG029]